MDEPFLAYTERLLKNIPLLEPLPTDLPAQLHKDPSIKAVLFDIYGTLLLSESDDIEQTSATGNLVVHALQDGNCVVDDLLPPEEILDLYIQAIYDSHLNSIDAGIDYPEVDCISIWKRVVKAGIDKGWIIKSQDIDIKRIAFSFEVSSNHTYPAPGLLKLYHYICQSGMPAGFISNAQFYTPIILRYFLSGDISEDIYIDGFAENLTFFSYSLGYAKPSVKLFEKAAESLKKNFFISPQEVLYIGNDLKKDIYTAGHCGFKTVLFAGDSRSLRLHTNEPKMTHITPDFIVTDLLQLREIFGDY